MMPKSLGIGSIGFSYETLVGTPFNQRLRRSSAPPYPLQGERRQRLVPATGRSPSGDAIMTQANATDVPRTDESIEHRTTTGDGSVSFDHADVRADAMRATVESWLDELAGLVDEARATDAFREWLDVQGRFHDYSARNALLIAQQRPDATRVAGYRTWQEAFDRQVREGESAIWIWAPVIARKCPECDHSRRYHESSGCEYAETPTEEWAKGVVAFKPVPVFDITQTEGETLPELTTGASGDGREALDRLLEAATSMGVAVRVVSEDNWSHGAAEGVCQWPNGSDESPTVEVRNWDDPATVAGTLAHELAHARLHDGVEASMERSKREVEAEAVAYLVGRYVGLDMSNSAFYLAAWQDEDREGLQARLDRISRTASRIIEVLDG